MPPDPMPQTSVDAISLFFTAPSEVNLVSEVLPGPVEGMVLVQASLSAISPGTEMLVYRGEFPSGMSVDASIGALAGEFAYPLKYGYSTVGRVAAIGPGVEAGWTGKRVFAFQPHASHFLSRPEDVFPIPDDISDEDAAFLPNMETAVNLVLDGAPLIGERVAVLGQGVVGLLTTALLGRFPLDNLVTFDHYPRRRQASLTMGAETSLDPSEVSAGEYFPEGFDLVYELSGDPAALDLAISLCGFSSRIVIGSWYGEKRAALDLGGRFHRERIRLVSSQVSTIEPAHSGRWEKTRRMEVAWEMIRQVKPAGSNQRASLITHTFPIRMAREAYRLIDEKPAETIQVVFDYTKLAEN